MKRQRSESGQIAVILALAMVGLLAFTALAIDGGNMYLQKRNAQNAADAGAISGTREVHRLLHTPYEEWPAAADRTMRIMINDFVQSNGVPDTNDNASDNINENIEAYYLDRDGHRLSENQVGTTGVVPEDSRGIQVIASIPFDTFIAGLIGQPHAIATADAGAVYEQETSSYYSAIYAGGTCTPHNLDLSGSYQYLVGGMHSNSNIDILGNAAEPSYYSGTVEYAGEIHYQEDQMEFDNPDGGPTDCGVEDFPVIFNPNDYAPGSDKAQDATDLFDYYYYPDDGTGSQPDMIAADGIHFSDHPNGIKIPANFPADPFRVTVVTRYPIRFQADTVLTPYIDGLLLFSTYGNRDCPSNDTAITLSGNRFNWEGLIYAPNGHIDMSASDNSSLLGLIVGWTVSLSGSQIEVIYDPRYDPPPPPRVVLVW
jgi:hypothetical protein